MQIILENEVVEVIWNYYYDAMKNHPNTWFPDNADNMIDNV